MGINVRNGKIVLPSLKIFVFVTMWRKILRMFFFRHKPFGSNHLAGSQSLLLPDSLLSIKTDAIG